MPEKDYDEQSATEKLKYWLSVGSIEFSAENVAYMLAAEIDKLREEIKNIKENPFRQ